VQKQSAVLKVRRWGNEKKRCGFFAKGNTSDRSDGGDPGCPAKTRLKNNRPSAIKGGRADFGEGRSWEREMETAVELKRGALAMSPPESKKGKLGGGPN